jgi:metacaspase-1
MRRILSSGKYTQIPQLSSSHPMDLDQPFYIVPPDCTGTKRAVLIGINYQGHTQGELSGCHNDLWNIKDYIMEVWGLEESNITILMDDDDGYHTSPTRSNILDAYRTVVSQSSSGDAIFCHYSGEYNVYRIQSSTAKKSGYMHAILCDVM